jgi:hypothetical protein
MTKRNVPAKLASAGNSERRRAAQKDALTKREKQKRNSSHTIRGERSGT